MPTKIEWCDETWNPITGCTSVSEGCKNCYAADMANRLRGRFGYPKENPFRPGIYHDDKMIEPSRWRKSRRIFVCSMGDLFHESVSDERINRVFARMVHPMAGSDHHTFMLLTKRPERILKGHPEHFKGWPNVWLGVTAENQKRYDERWKVLSKIPAWIRFVSVEPMLEPVSIHFEIDKPEWVICGPETGKKARFFDFEWARSLRDQCKKYGIPFFYKAHDRKETPDDLKIAEFPALKPRWTGRFF